MNALHQPIQDQICFWKPEIKRQFAQLWKKNRNGVATPLDFRQKNDVKNTTVLEPYYLVEKLTSKTCCNDSRFWSEQRRRKHNLVTTLLRRCPTLSQLKSNQKLTFVTTSYSSWDGICLYKITNSGYYHGVFLYLGNLLKSISLWSHPRLGNLNETQHVSSPGFFLKILNSIFPSINMGVDHKLPLQLFLIGFCIFCSKIGKR